MSFKYYCPDGEEEYASKPMAWIGMYIAIASLLCILAMAADLLHGFRSKRLWFPCKHFSLNAASITVITVAMKLPVDLSGDMPSYLDQAAKLGSLAFMCTMIANLMPSLASMGNKTLVVNVIGLSILVITMIVNIYIQTKTGVVHPLYAISHFSLIIDCIMFAQIYNAILILLLIISISSSLTIPTSKEIFEFKYQATSKTSLSDQSLQHNQMFLVEKLRKHVTRCWVMAETSCPQFVIASNPLSTASGLICVIVLVMNLFVVLKLVSANYNGSAITYTSAYTWSIPIIVITQTIGVTVGAVAPILRCFSVSSFKLANKRDRDYPTVFIVEKYWTQKLREWKQSRIPFLSSGHISRTLVYNSIGIILSLWIRFQKVIVVLCKLISLVPKNFVYCIYRWKSMKARLFTPPNASRTDDINVEIGNYVLQINDEIELAEKTLKHISKSINSFILKAEKEQNKDLLELLEKSTGFKGVDFDTDNVQSLLSVVLVNSWSLPLVTLTCITIALPNIRKDKVESLLRCVGEGLSYTHLVEECLNCASEYVNIRKATMTLWDEVKYECKWLDNTLAKNDFDGKTATEILKWFADKAKGIVTGINESISGEMVENTPKELIVANSMYRIAQTILFRDESNREQINEEQLFTLLNGMIADILSACFTNLPRVITTKCQESVIEKREASVKAAAKLFGKTRKIIERLQTCELPSMDHDKMAYVDEWRLYFKQSIP